MDRILKGRYDNDLKSFKEDVLDCYGNRFEDVFDRLVIENRDRFGLVGRRLMEDILGDFVKAI